MCTRITIVCYVHILLSTGYTFWNLLLVIIITPWCLLGELCVTKRFPKLPSLKGLLLSHVSVMTTISKLFGELLSIDNAYLFCKSWIFKFLSIPLNFGGNIWIDVFWFFSKDVDSSIDLFHHFLYFRRYLRVLVCFVISYFFRASSSERALLVCLYIYFNHLLI